MWFPIFRILNESVDICHKILPLPINESKVTLN